MATIGAASGLVCQMALASCNDVSRDALQTIVNSVQNAPTGGYKVPANLKMWATMVDETGKVCYVVTSGEAGRFAGNSAWLGSRVISAQKAFTANAFSLDGYAISTANLFRTVQDGHDLYGLQHSNPVDANHAYLGNPNDYGTKKDPIVGKRIGGVNVFGGGLALYKDGKKKIGAIGVSGDTACRDHAFAWRLRGILNMHPFENGPALGSGLGQPVGSGLGTGITTYNIDKDGNVLPGGMLTGAKYGDELILSTTTPKNAYWQDTWSHAVCVGSIKDPNGVAIATPENGILVNE